MKLSNHYDAIVIGAGPAGLTAGIYLSRARVNTLILNEGTIGGQMVLTHEIANYPGVESISGYQLATIMKKQALNFGSTIKSNVRIKDLDLQGELKQVTLHDDTVITARSIILTPGGRSRTLGVEGEELFKGKGISYCATCDGDFFTGKEIVVVGGGNSALEEAVSLTRYASKVTIVHQFDHFQAFEHAIAEVQNHPQIDILMESAVTGFQGTENLESIRIRNLRSGQSSLFPTSGVFVFIGYVPNTEFLQGKLKLNQQQEIMTGPDMSTSVRGVFAAGDSIAKRYRQVTTAVGEATVAALAASSFINELKARQKSAVLVP